MKEYQDLIGRLIMAAAIIISSLIIGNAITEAGNNIGPQIASALNFVAQMISNE